MGQIVLLVDRRFGCVGGIEWDLIVVLLGHRSDFAGSWLTDGRGAEGRQSDNPKGWTNRQNVKKTTKSEK